MERILDTKATHEAATVRRHGDPSPLALGPGLDELALRGAWPSEHARLLAAARQALSTPRARSALVLGLSRLPPPLPRPHHRRIAFTILEEAARLYRGETFDLPCGDLVLLCQAPADGGGELHPDALGKVFARLLRIDVPAATALTTVWALERDGAALLSYIAARQA